MKQDKPSTSMCRRAKVKKSDVVFVTTTDCGVLTCSTCVFAKPGKWNVCGEALKETKCTPNHRADGKNGYWHTNTIPVRHNVPSLDLCLAAGVQQKDCVFKTAFGVANKCDMCVFTNVCSKFIGVIPGSDTMCSYAWRTDGISGYWEVKP